MWMPSRSSVPAPILGQQSCDVAEQANHRGANGAHLLSLGVMPSGPASSTPLSTCRFSPATRTMKNSSMIGAHEGEEHQAFEQRVALILRLFEHAPLEVDQAQLAIDIRAGSSS